VTKPRQPRSRSIYPLDGIALNEILQGKRYLCIAPFVSYLLSTVLAVIWALGLRVTVTVIVIVIVIVYPFHRSLWLNSATECRTCQKTSMHKQLIIQNCHIHIHLITKHKLHGLSSRANYTDRATAAVGEVIANFCGYRVPRGQRDGTLRPYSRFSRQAPLLFYQVAPYLYSRG
jgi:hypothetical protein